MSRSRDMISSILLNMLSLLGGVHSLVTEPLLLAAVALSIMYAHQRLG